MSILPILKEPFLHFFALGIAIFAGYTWISEVNDGGQIVITSAQQNSLLASFEQTWQRRPTPLRSAMLTEAAPGEPRIERQFSRIHFGASSNAIYSEPLIETDYAESYRILHWR